jgi:Uma2 family endonuclease
MAHPAPSEAAAPARYTVERYLSLVDEGVLGPDDRVELLAGVIVTMTPSNPPHDTSVNLILHVLIAAVGGRAAVRCQSSLVLAPDSVPEPDVAVVPGRLRDYAARHPTTALLIVEVADSSLVQDRLTKAGLYAAGGIPEYWLVNLRDHCIEVFRNPVADVGRYADMTVASPGARLQLVALPDVSVAVEDLLLDA